MTRVPHTRYAVDPALVVETADYLTERLNSRLTGLDDKLTARILASENAQKLAHEDASRIPTVLMQTEIRLIGLIRDNKEDASGTLKIALDGTRELFKLQTDANSAQIKAVDDKSDINTTRIAALEVRMGSGDGVKKGSNETIYLLFGFGGFIFGLVGAVVAVIAVFSHH